MSRPCGGCSRNLGRRSCRQGFALGQAFNQTIQLDAGYAFEHFRRRSHELGHVIAHPGSAFAFAGVHNGKLIDGRDWTSDFLRKLRQHFHHDIQNRGLAELLEDRIEVAPGSNVGFLSYASLVA